MPAHAARRGFGRTRPASPIRIPQAVRQWVAESTCAKWTAPQGPLARIMLLASSVALGAAGFWAGLGLLSSSEDVREEAESELD